MQIERPILDALGGLETVATAVTALATEWEQHAFTVGVPAPSAHPLIEAIWRAGGVDNVEVIDPPIDGAPVPVPRAIPALDFRRRFTPPERAAVTLAASRALEHGDATLQVWLDDVNAALAVHLDSLSHHDAFAISWAADLARYELAFGDALARRTGITLRRFRFPVGQLADAVRRGGPIPPVRRGLTIGLWLRIPGRRGVVHRLLFS